MVMVFTPMSQREAPIYNIKAVAHLTGVPADTLRRWESRYGIISPQRTEGGYRLYSQRDVDTINWLKGKLEEGLSISRACEMLRQAGGDLEHIAPAQASPARPVAAERPPSAESGVRSFPALRADLMDAFRAIDEERAAATLTDALGLYSLEEVCLEVMQPVLVEVGDAWLDGTMSVAAEHFASSARADGAVQDAFFEPCPIFSIKATTICTALSYWWLAPPTSSTNLGPCFWLSSCGAPDSALFTSVRMCLWRASKA